MELTSWTRLQEGLYVRLSCKTNFSWIVIEMKIIQTAVKVTASAVLVLHIFISILITFAVILHWNVEIIIEKKEQISVCSPVVKVAYLGLIIQVNRCILTDFPWIFSVPLNECRDNTSRNRSSGCYFPLRMWVVYYFIYCHTLKKKKNHTLQCCHLVASFSLIALKLCIRGRNWKDYLFLFQTLPGNNLVISLD